MDRQLIKLPFPGFYNTEYSVEFDRAQEQEAEHIAEQDDLDESDVNEAFFRHARYHEGYLALARAYVEAFNELLKDEKGIDLELEFESMTSPKEYNFATDRIFCWCPENAVLAVFTATNQGDLADAIKRNHTSYDGFISFYSNDVETWLAKPLDTWDYNEVATLLEAFLAGEEDWEFRIFSAMADTEVFYTAFQNCVDWPAFEAAIEEMKNENVWPDWPCLGLGGGEVRGPGLLL